MAFNLDPVYLLNFALCIVIVMLGAYAYRRKKSFIPLLIGVAFGLFAISHLMTLLDMAKTLETPLIGDQSVGLLDRNLRLVQVYRADADKQKLKTQKSERMQSQLI